MSEKLSNGTKNTKQKPNNQATRKCLKFNVDGYCGWVFFRPVFSNNTLFDSLIGPMYEKPYGMESHMGPPSHNLYSISMCLLTDVKGEKL